MEGWFFFLPLVLSPLLGFVIPSFALTLGACVGLSL